MEGISDIRIVGLDEKRWPKVRKEPYINLYFTLSHKVPAVWCADFNRLLSKHKYTPRIKEDEGLYIETWVRTADEVPGHLAELKDAVARCVEEYINQVKAATVLDSGKGDEGGAQGQLDRILGDLKFE